jgi:hypothetical protein
MYTRLIFGALLLAVFAGANRFGLTTGSTNPTRRSSTRSATLDSPREVLHP